MMNFFLGWKAYNIEVIMGSKFKLMLVIFLFILFTSHNKIVLIISHISVAAGYVDMLCFGNITQHF